ncbi:MAG: DUF4215 domain-containing protein [Polyangiaceae bacterium]
MRLLASQIVRLSALTLVLACGTAACDGSETTTQSPTSGGAGGTGGAGGSTGGTGGAIDPVCGDGILTPPELCDDGNTLIGDGCDNDCSFSCTKGTPQGDAKCDDDDPCNGAETCADTHVCIPGTSQPDGTPCGEAKICKSATCSDISCGDGYLDPGEDCDDANLDPTDGCDACQFPCVVDPDCDNGDLCAGLAVCEVDHTCTYEPAADGTPCPGGACVSGACKLSTCGDGVVEPGEECDDGNIVGGDGCEPTCKSTCLDAATDCPSPLPCNKAACTPQKTCTTEPDPAQDGQDCGVDLQCSAGACIGVGASCGNGVIEPGEDCDFGFENGPGAGCELTCKFSCTKSPDSCADQNACNGVEACNTVVNNGKLGQACSVGSTLPQCASCGSGVCKGGTCAPSSCGDGCVDPSKGESCEPPSSPTCDAACKTKICGNGIRETGEDCDDGNTVNLDGCSSTCRFEQIHRVRYLVLQYASDAYCTNNKLGLAITGTTAQSQLQGAIDEGLYTGYLGVLLQFIGLDDLSGTTDPQLQIGAMNGTPKKLGQPYDGSNDLDFWYFPDPTSLDANKVPLTIVPAQIAAKSLTAGPGTLILNMSFGAGSSSLVVTNVKLAITVGPTSTPLTSFTNLPPGHKLSEQLNPALTSFATAGQPNANGSGKLCGNVTALSLANMPVPEDLTTGGFACSEGYPTTASMLDLFVGGCTVFGVKQISPTQPDQADPAAAPAGAGAPYVLALNAQKTVSTCTDKNGASVPIGACLNAAAYSSFFRLATGRVIAK